MAKGIVISVINAKGGVAKTTSTLNLADALSKMSHKVLVVDFDPQGGLSGACALDLGDLGLHMADVILDDISIKEVIRKAPGCSFDIAPTNIDLSVAEVALIDHTEKGWTIEDQRSYRERRLVKALHDVRDHYDIILIDNQPSLGILTINSLCVSDYIIIPVATEFMSLMGLQNVLKLIELLASRRNSAAKIIGVLPTLTDLRTNHAKDMLKELYRICKIRNIPFLKSYIPRSVRVQEAAINGVSMIEWMPASDVALAYTSIAKYINSIIAEVTSHGDEAASNSSARAR